MTPQMVQYERMVLELCSKFMRPPMNADDEQFIEAFEKHDEKESAVLAVIAAARKVSGYIISRRDNDDFEDLRQAIAKYDSLIETVQ